jgi:hypothetical protein
MLNSAEEYAMSTGKKCVLMDIVLRKNACRKSWKRKRKGEGRSKSREDRRWHRAVVSMEVRILPGTAPRLGSTTTQQSKAPRVSTWIEDLG